MGAEASNAHSRSNGKLCPRMTATGHGSGRRSTASRATRSTMSATSARGTDGTRMMPRPRTSSLLSSPCGALAITLPSRMWSQTWSSATNNAGNASNAEGANDRQRSARSDFPEPDAPRIRAARPPSATAVAWTHSLVAVKRASRPIGARNADNESRAAHSFAIRAVGIFATCACGAIFGVDHAPVA